MTTLKIKKLTETATTPEKAHETDAGLDFFYDGDDIKLYLGERYLLSTGIAMAIPTGWYGQLADRSGNAFKKGFHVMAGVIDSDYRGEVKVLVFNTNKDGKPLEIKRGDKIAQMIFHQVPVFSIEETESLDETVRGDGGFGSTDKK